jgi:hypothetical protein
MTVISNKRLTGNPWRQRELELVLKWERKLSDLSDKQVISLSNWLTSRKKIREAANEEETL